MRLIILLIALVWQNLAFAEHINGHNTWVAQDRATAGMLHYAAGSGGRWGWTTNGRTFDCALISKDEANHSAELFCPSISYRMYLSRYELAIVSQGGTTRYSGQWDDRRYWYYNSGGMTGRFYLRDNFEWTEQQWVSGQLTQTFNFKEWSRDDNYIYLDDASRGIQVAIGKTQVYVRSSGQAWAHFYNGTW